MVRRVLALDEAILLFLLRWRSKGVTALMRAFTRLGDASSWVLTAIAMLCAGGAAVRPGLLVGVSAGIAAALSQTLKRVCRRARPTSGIAGFTALMENPDAFSFPSGHSAAAFAVALALAGSIPGGQVFVGLAFCVAVSRVYLGAHYPLDVFAGATLGIFAGALTRLVLL